MTPSSGNQDLDLLPRSVIRYIAYKSKLLRDPSAKFHLPQSARVTARGTGMPYMCCCQDLPQGLAELSLGICLVVAGAKGHTKSPCSWEMSVCSYALLWALGVGGEVYADKVLSWLCIPSTSARHVVQQCLGEEGCVSAQLLPHRQCQGSLFAWKPSRQEEHTRLMSCSGSSCGVHI